MLTLNRLDYQNMVSLETILLDKFPDGQMVFRWTYRSNKYWIPNKPYVRIRCKLTKSDGVSSLTPSDNLTMAMNPAPQLFQSGQYKIADQMVSQITENFPQVDTLKNRTNKSGNWLSSCGSSINFWSHKYSDREHQLQSAG